MWRKLNDSYWLFQTNCFYSYHQVQNIDEVSPAIINSMIQTKDLKLVTGSENGLINVIIFSISKLNIVWPAILREWSSYSTERWKNCVFSYDGIKQKEKQLEIVTAQLNQ